MPTVIPVGSPLAVKAFSVATFADTQRRPSFRRNIVGPAPKQADAESKLRGQSSPDYPVVQIKDLKVGAGDNVSVDLFNIVVGKPVMGDKLMAGKMMPLTFNSMDVKIDQYRAGVDPGGRMTQKRTVHNLRSIAKANLAGYAARLEDQLTQVHLAGARGYEAGIDWAVPLASDPDFAEICVNDVLPPTYNRRILGGDATGVADLASTDYLTLETVDRIRAQIDEDVFPMQPIRLINGKGDMDPAADDAPMYMLCLSSRQWHWLVQQTSDGDWRTFISNARARVDGWNHPLFTGECGMWNGILLKKQNRAIRFPAGTTVKEMDASGNIADATAAVATDRAILLGAQALAEAYGNHGDSGYHAKWHEEKADHGARVEFSVAFMGGKKKVRFKRLDTNQFTDHGVMAIDTYAPAPN